MTSSIVRIESCLGRDLHLFLRGTDSGGALSSLSSDLQFLLGELWETQDRWFDGVVDERVRVRKRLRVDIRGLMYWGTTGKNTRQWVDVFAADLLASKVADKLSSYTLRFGRKGHEHRSVPYGAHQELLRELEKPQNWTWAFEFKGVANS